MQLDAGEDRAYRTPQAYADYLQDTLAARLDALYDADPDRLIDVTDSAWRDIGHTADDFFGSHSWPTADGYIGRETTKWLDRAVNDLDDASVYDPVTADAVMQALQAQRTRAIHGEDSVVCIYTTDDDELLLIERGKLDHEGAWMPPAGRIEPDESPEAAATREMLEETGITADFEQIGEAHDDDYRATLHIMQAKADDVVTAEAGSDAAAAEWVDYDDLPEVSMPSTMHVIAAAAPYLAAYQEATVDIDDPMDILDWPRSGHYIIDRPADGDVPDTTTIFTDTSMFKAGFRDDGEAYVWVEALGHLSPPEEQLLRGIGEELTGTSDWEKTFDGVVEG